MTMKKIYDFSRFLTVQKDEFENFKNKLVKKEKIYRGVYYFFPTLRGTEESIMGDFYGLEDIKEAKAYYKNPIFKKRLIELVEIILTHGKDFLLESIFDFIDLQWFYSSMTLFYMISKEKCFKKVIWTYFDGILDQRTILLCKKML